VGVVVCNENRRGDWEQLVAKSRDAASGHLWEWRDIIASSYGFEPFYLMAEDDRARPIAGVPFVFVRSLLYGNELASMPYIDYGGICHDDRLESADRQRADRQIIEAAHRLAKDLRAKRLHIRSLNQHPHPFEVSTEKVTQHLALAKTIEEQMERLPSERRNRLKRCAKLELSAERVDPSAPGAMETLCAVYLENMRDLGSPSHSREFFYQLIHRLRGHISLIFVRHNNRAVAAGIAFEFRGAMTLPWTGATYEARPVYGSVALYWEGIRLAIERGCHTFDFGRSTAGSGIFEFKRQWGPTAVQSYWSTLYLKPGAAAPRNRSGLKAMSKIWRYMPLGVARAVGPGLRRGISN